MKGTNVSTMTGDGAVRETKVQNQKHTPGPWAVGVGKYGASTITTADAPFLQAINGRKLIADVPLERNAQFIVRACNAHEELLNACKELTEAITELRETEGYRHYMDISETFTAGHWIEGRLLKPFAKARAAIAKAEKGDS